ncbi:MAG: glycosyltransferase family 39 protein [Caldilineaceae bacterium]|nr:glycosyltransferase family 39 protein [Caldilineaceae bacterium]
MYANHRIFRLLLLLIVLVGALLRICAIGEKSVWLDEAFSIWVANHSQTEVWRWLMRIDQHPPLYYSLLSLWQALFGDLQGAARLFSALCGIVSIPLFYAAARRLTQDEITGLMAATILAISPFHVRYAQEARMYGLLTLTVAAAFYCLVRVLSQPILADHERWWLILPRRSMIGWIGFTVAQAATMLTHNTATVFFPLAVNLPILGFWLFRRGCAVSLPALESPSFLRFWLQTQGLAILLWSPWAAPFVFQSLKVDEEFWLLPPTATEIWNAWQTFNFAHLPGDFPLMPVWMGIYGGLALFGLFRLRHKPLWLLLLLSLALTPIAGELLVSLRRPIFYDRTLIWTTLPYYLLIAIGIRGLALPKIRWFTQAAALVMMAVLSGFSLYNYYVHFEKEDWSSAAAYVAARAEPDDLLVFHATWVQIPFEYYFRHYNLDLELRGAPVDLFDRGVLEPKMTNADLSNLRDLVQGRPRVWLIYAHDWYTDPEGLIPRQLATEMCRLEERHFVGLRIAEFVERGQVDPEFLCLSHNPLQQHRQGVDSTQGNVTPPD